MLEDSVEAPEAPLPEVGLTSEEVRARVAAGQVNALPNRTSRSVWDIVRANIFTWFNLILGVLFVFMITFGSWRDALFGSIVVINAVIGIAQEMRAKITLDRLSLLTAPTARVVRDGTERDIPIAEIVIDEVVRLSPGDQIAADGDVLHSQGLEVDESLLTGESVPVLKSQGADLLSGSFVVAGAGFFQVKAVGDQAFAQRIAGEGRRYVRMRSDLQDGINGFLKVVGLGIVPMAALLIWSQWRAGVSVADGVTNTVAALVAMVPQGLVLMTSIAFAVSAVVLARRNVLVQELPAVEGLARVDVLCVDKTGAITEPQPVFLRFEPADAATSPHGPPPELAAFAAAVPASNATIHAIRAALPTPIGWEVEETVPFSSARKWSAVRFADRSSWVLGAPEIVLGTSSGATAIAARATELAATGSRVLLLSRAEAPLAGERLPDALMPVGLVVLGEHVRADAPETLRYFTGQGVGVKVISGDNAATVETVAIEAGVPGASPAVDARTLPEGDALKEVMERTAVFGRVTPDQKRAMVTALQQGGHTVAMTGDGVNDVLALKQADLGIAMGSGTEATKAVAQLILLDGRFSTLPGVVAEGRRVTANIERVASLFMTKTVWAVVVAVVVGLFALPYPIMPRQLTLIDAVTIGIPAFFLALAPNTRRYRPGFARRVARFTLPMGVIAGAAVLLCFVATRGIGASLEQARTLDMLLLSVVGLRVIVVLERPVRGWRLGLVTAMGGWWPWLSSSHSRGTSWLSSCPTCRRLWSRQRSSSPHGFSPDWCATRTSCRVRWGAPAPWERLLSAAPRIAWWAGLWWAGAGWCAWSVGWWCRWRAPSSEWHGSSLCRPCSGKSAVAPERSRSCWCSTKWWDRLRTCSRNRSCT